MELSGYLERIKYQGELGCDLATLTALHRAHLINIPYENLDVHLQRRTTTDVAAAYEKIVTRKRGGWCYEMNGLFGWALAQAGFNVTRIAAQGVAPASHLCLRVDLDRPYCCDVGFTDGPYEPYAIGDHDFEQEGFEFRVVMREGGGWRLYNHRFGAVPFYDAGVTDEAALEVCCATQQTSPDSVHVRNVVVVSHKDGAILTMIGRVLRMITPTGVTRLLIESADDYVAALQKHFGLDLPEAASLWPSICARHDEVFGFVPAGSVGA